MSEPDTRRYDLDWLRIAAFGLLVVYHVGMYYVSWDWHVKSPHASPLAEPFMLASSPWRMSLLFLISGVASAFLIAKSGNGFLGQRSWRLLLPLIFGMLVVVPPQSYYQVVEQLPGGYHDGYWAFWKRYLAADDQFCREGDCLRVPTWNHLWFVAYLWVYTVLLWVLVRLAPRRSETLGRWLGTQLQGWKLLLLPSAYLALARIGLADRFESTHALAGDWYNHAQYLPVFLLGFLVARETAFWDAMQRLRRPALWLALGSWLCIAGWYSLFQMEGQIGTLPGELWLPQRRLLWGLMQWNAIVAACGYARHWAPGDSPARRYLTEAVFPVYILHQTLIVVLSQQIKPLALPAAAEAPLLIALTLAGCFAGYELVRRIRWLRPLMGLSELRPVPLPGTPGSAAQPEPSRPA